VLVQSASRETRELSVLGHIVVQIMRVVVSSLIPINACFRVGNLLYFLNAFLKEEMGKSSIDAAGAAKKSNKPKCE